MIRPFISRIVAVICRNEKQVIFSEPEKQLTQLFIEAFQLLSVAHRVPSVAPQCIKIYQVRKAQPTKIAAANLYRLIHSMN